jgi:hypothetical protein
MIFRLSTCKNLVQGLGARTFPAMRRDPDRPEDPDTRQHRRMQGSASARAMEKTPAGSASRLGGPPHKIFKNTI